eukprot:g5183.t1
MATFDVIVDDDAVMKIQPALATTSAQWDAFPAGKAMSRLSSREYQLPPDLEKRILTHVRMEERCLTCTCYHILAVLCCFLPYACYDTQLWNPERDPDNVAQEVRRLFEAEGIAPEDYRIVEFYGTQEKFTQGRVILKVHFSQPGVHEL